MPEQKLIIYIAPRRDSKAWARTEEGWGDFARRFSPHNVRRVKETTAEYQAMTKDDRARIKDAGGYVGGTLKDGVRKKGSVADRCLLVLDADRADNGTWDQVCEKFAGVASLCHTTCSHTPQAPRLRIIFPLDRAVSPEEYGAISRRVAQEIGLEYFDATTHEVNRMMFWPVVCRDGEYWCDEQPGVPLCADEVLATYEDWRDMTRWPGMDGAQGHRAQGMDKAADPLEKPGLIGAFCRTYTMADAIEKFLPDVYGATTSPGRYTYKGGHTAGGLVIYGDKFAYSHHDTDPAGGRLLNAFDLVRLHKFGNLDDQAKTGTPVNRLPSYYAMENFCISDPDIKAEAVRAQTEKAAADFAGIDPETIDARRADIERVLTRLEVDRKGRVLRNPSNLRIIRTEDPLLRRVRRNDFDGSDMTETAEFTGVDDGTLCRVDDGTLKRISRYIFATYGLEITPKKVMEELTPRESSCAWHPVKEFIEAAKWDGTPRVNRLLIDYLGAEDSHLTKEITRKWITAAVMRIYEPGAEFHNVLTLTGPQAVGKSYFLRRLAVCPEWFTDNLNLAGTDAQRREAAQGKWIVELNELTGLRRAEWQALKGYISQNTDRGRLAYAVAVSESPRQFVFAASTNDDAFIRESDKGNRRWWIVPVTRRGRDWPDNPEKLKALQHQIWAEAYRMYLEAMAAGENLNELSPESRDAMSKRQFDFSEDNDEALRKQIVDYLAINPPVLYSAMTDKARRGFYADEEGNFHERGPERRRLFFAHAFINDYYGLPSAAVRPEKGTAIIGKINAIMRSLPGWKNQTIRYPGFPNPVKGFSRTAGGDGEEDDDII